MPWQAEPIPYGRGEAMSKMKITKPQYENIGIDVIVPSPDNPRIINKKAQEFLDLVDSIRGSGVLIPIHVRQHPKQKGKYELLAGERRLIAAQICQLKTLPAIVHDGMSDEEAFELSFAENFAREDLTVMEQGKAVIMLLAKYKNDRQAVASKIGKSIQWVSQRIALAKNLSKNWQQALTEPEQDMEIPRWPASHLQRIAVFPKDVQDQLLEDIAYDEMPTTPELDELLKKQLMALSQAPWDVANAELIETAKACSKCPKRSSAQPGLWDDTLDAEAIKKNDRCLDRNCWDDKMTAFIKARALELRAKYPNLVAAVMPDQNVKYNDRQQLEQQYGLVAYQWKLAKEGGKDAVPALIVFGAQAGELKFIKLPEGAKASTAEGKTRPIGKDGKPKPRPLKERRALLKKKRWFVTVREVIELLKKKQVSDITTKNKILTVMALVVEFGTKLAEWDGVHRHIERCSWRSFAKKTDQEKVLAELWQRAKESITAELTYNGPITQTPDECIAGAKTMAKITGIDIKAIYKKASETEYPEPKCWAGLNEDGKPKKKVDKKKTKKRKS